jgi:hypothetical protein
MAAAFADSGMGRDRLEPFVVAQGVGREVGGRNQVVEVAVRASGNER